MNTLGGTSKVKYSVQEDGSIDMSFPCAAVIPDGTQVKLLNTGYVAAIAAVTDKPFGVVSVGNKVAGDRVTVKTPFIAINNRAQASGTVAIADEVAAEALDGTTLLMKYKTAVTTNYVSGVCLSGGATTTEIIVGVLRTPKLI